jgi:hypothetical protein
MPRKIELDSETADQITLLNLINYRAYLKKELRNYKKGSWLHPEDVINNQRVIEAIDILIKQFGG